VQSHQPTVLSILGGRPHLIKCEPISRALRTAKIEHSALRCQLGNLSDYPLNASDDFLLPVHALIATDVFDLFRNDLHVAIREIGPDVILVYGDLPATLLAAVSGASLGIKMIHVEAGYRSGDLADPEENVRVAVDHIASHRVTFSELMSRNLVNEGIPPTTISITGNPALQVLYSRMKSDIGAPQGSPTALATFHHTENFQSREAVLGIIESLETLSSVMPVTVIAYRRLRDRLIDLNLNARLESIPDVTVVPTQPYPSYLRLLASTHLVITDSSGLQDECHFLGKPCIVMRRSTSRPYVHDPTSGQVLWDPHAIDLTAVLEKVKIEAENNAPRTDLLIPTFDGTLPKIIYDITEAG
jgi:UDP-N-acetylglucosamine 2-epimerase (non-hydrolysing)